MSPKSSDRVRAAGWCPVYRDREDGERRGWLCGRKSGIPFWMCGCLSGFVVKATFWGMSVVMYVKLIAGPDKQPVLGKS